MMMAASTAAAAVGAYKKLTDRFLLFYIRSYVLRNSTTEFFQFDWIGLL